MTKSEAIATELQSIEATNLLSTQSSIERTAQVGFDPEQLIPTQTYIEAGVEKLTTLAQAVGLQDKLPQIIEIFRAMTVSWGDRKVGEKTTWQSDVSDDCAPFEFSIALNPDKTELRVLIEAQGTDPNLQSNWQAGLALNQYLAEHYQISLDRFQQIEDLFVPTNPDAKFSIWHSACFYPDKEPAFKLYLNPQSQVKSRAAAVVEESLVRLGFPHAWIGLAEVAAQRGPDQDDFVYFSLDLANQDRARVKVYLRHYDATLEDLEKALSLANNYVAGDATEFCQALIQTKDLFTLKPIVSCFSFLEGNQDRPSSGTLYIPIGYYTPNDLLVRDSLHQYLSNYSLPASTYNRAIQSFTTRSLNSGSGMHSHISMRREEEQWKTTVYLNPELNTVRRNGLTTTEIPTWKPKLSIEETAQYYQTNSIADHPFFQRLQREPVNLTHLWLLFANGRDGIVANFTRRLANIIGRIDDEHIRCILTKQLNEELGNGDISQVHRKLFDRLIFALEPHKPQLVTEAMLAPGRELNQRLEVLYADSNSSVGLGAAIVMEIRGKQIDEEMGKEFANRTTIDRDSLIWLNLHEELEIGHAEEAQEIARLVGSSNGDLDAARQGAERTANALEKFFTGMYRVCFL